MRVALSTTPREIVLQERPDPVAGPGEVVCRVLACGVCGSDVSESWVARKVPVVLGHELTAEVVTIGAGVTSVAVGDRVVVHHHAPCGECARCRSGHETLCDHFRATALDPGGFAERVRVPADLVGELLELGEVDAERGTFVEPLACVLRAFDRVALDADDRLLVVGAGTSGLLAVAAARARGVRQIAVAEPRPERLALAEELGATATGLAESDVAVVCTSAPAALRDAFAALAPGGRLCLYAPPAPGEVPELEGLSWYTREIEVVPSYSAGPGDMKAALALIAGGAVDPLPLITHRLGLDETAQALELARSGGAVKALVVP